jgi:DnaJ-class molecular chaperone
MLIREIDDLELVECQDCRGDKSQRRACRTCNGTGDRVVHREKFYERIPRQRRPRSEKEERRER